MYTLARQLLFKLSPETSHELSIDLIGAGGRLGLNRLLTPKPASLPVSVLGLEFPNPVGLAAGLDKNGDAIDGFGRSVSASSRSAPSLRDRSRAIPSRACSACRKPTRSSIAWASTTTASTTCWHGCVRRSIAAYWGSTSARTSIPRWSARSTTI